MLSDASYTSAGLGAYPKDLKSKCGHGPSKEVTREMIESPESFEYDFETIKNFDILRFEAAWSIQDMFREWNSTFQYWFAMYVYKSFPIKRLRAFATFVASAYWHGIYLGIYTAYFTLIFAYHVERQITELLKPKELSPELFSIYKNCMRFLNNSLKFYFLFSYVLVDANKIWRFYNSVYHCFDVLVGSLILICYIGLWRRKRENKDRTD